MKHMNQTAAVNSWKYRARGTVQGRLRMVLSMSIAPGPADNPGLVVERRNDGSVLLRSETPWADDDGCLHDWLFAWADKTPERIFLNERGSQTGPKWCGVTYGEAAQRVTRLARALAGMGLGPERPILILSGNAIEHQLLALAAMMVGVPFAPISVAYSTAAGALPKLQFVLAALDPGLVYAADGEVFARALTIPEMAGRTLVVGRNAGAVSGAVSFAEIEQSGMSHPSRLLPRPTPDTMIKLIFTSGSTGQPKGVITTHRMVRNDVEAIAQVLGIEPGRMVALDWLPWSHVYGGSFGIGMTLRNGGTLHIDDGKPVGADYARTVENLQGVSPTVFWNVPKAYECLAQALAADSALCRSFFADLSVMIYGAASLPSAVLDTMNALVARHAPRPIPMIPAWGLTETTTIASIGDGPAIVPNAIGRPLPGVELKLVPNGDKLEARVKGAIITPGYRGLSEVTASAFDEEGFFRTGDAMRLFDDARPELGLLFEGRVAEDFKLLSGTWVNVTEVRAHYLSALNGLAADVVVAGPDRDDLALLIFPVDGVATGDAAHATRVAAALAQANAGRSGTSRTIARAAIVGEPPTAATGEVTEKGSLNSRRILQNRQDLIDLIYDGMAEGMILRPPSGPVT